MLYSNNDRIERKDIMKNEMFPDSLTQEEENLGYQIEETDNTEGQYAFHLHTMKAVVCRLGPSDRIIKMRDPSGTIIYKRQRFGTWGWDTKGTPSWLPFGDTWDYSPEEAILKVRAGVQVESVKITMHDPKKNIT
jgi:hypothetical protein